MQSICTRTSKCDSGLPKHSALLPAVFSLSHNNGASLEPSTLTIIGAFCIRRSTLQANRPAYTDINSKSVCDHALTTESLVAHHHTALPPARCTIPLEPKPRPQLKVSASPSADTRTSTTYLSMWASSASMRSSASFLLPQQRQHDSWQQGQCDQKALTGPQDRRHSGVQSLEKCLRLVSLSESSHDTESKVRTLFNVQGGFSPIQMPTKFLALSDVRRHCSGGLGGGAHDKRILVSST